MCVERDGRLTGVLNDFDIAAVMTPGSRFPRRDDNNLAGTRPFMTLDLIKYPVEAIKRWYRYDLESFAWCLAWMMLVSPRSRLDGDEESFFFSKHAFMVNIKFYLSDLKREWRQFGVFFVQFFSDWRSHYDRLNYAVIREMTFEEA